MKNVKDVFLNYEVGEVSKVITQQLKEGKDKYFLVNIGVQGTNQNLKGEEWGLKT